MAEKKQPIGALWERQSKSSGSNYFNGNITLDGKTHKIVIFENTFRETENHPGYKIYLSDLTAGNTPAPASKPAAKATAKPSSTKPALKKPVGPTPAVDEFNSNDNDGELSGEDI